MKRNFLYIMLLCLPWCAQGQSKVLEQIKGAANRNVAASHLTFLAADEMRGRGTGSPELAIAANYIAAQFKMLGLKSFESTPGYFQPVGLRRTFPPVRVEFKLGTTVFKFKDDLLLRDGKSSVGETAVVFLGYGSDADFGSQDVAGKIVVTRAGTSDKSEPGEAFRESRAKLKRATAKGAAALVEIINFPQLPWARLAGYFASGQVELTTADEAAAMPRVWMRMTDSPELTALLAGKPATGSLAITAAEPKQLKDKNVLALIEGTDPKLRQEYVVVSAHYDHIGVNKNAVGDSINNGARDNALGTSAILQAAAFFAKHPPKRSIIFAALCAEEVGLFGSKWFVEHPPVPLKQVVYNLDCDGAGYNDKSIVTLIDLNRTTADVNIRKGCETFGLTLKGDPEPTQNLYERSDNYNFAAKGIPAVDFSPGIKGFDEELMKYYHQPPDEVGSLDFDYLEKFFRAFVYSAYLIANDAQRPLWKAGDKFEPVGKELYR